VPTVCLKIVAFTSYSNVGLRRVCLLQTAQGIGKVNGRVSGDIIKKGFRSLRDTPRSMHLLPGEYLERLKIHFMVDWFLYLR
jgi:hypothetical protein